MTALLAVLWVIGSLAIVVAVCANRRTSLLLTMLWVSVAWLAAGWFLWHPSRETHYLVLALIGTAGISVLGARWPGAAAWQFVVVGLICVMLLPLLEAELLNQPMQWSGLRIVFALGLFGMAVLNYSPTPLGPSAASVTCGTISSLIEYSLDVAQVTLAAAPAIAWLCFALCPQGSTQTTRLWIAFKNRFGAIWTLRVLEQFNRSAANSGSKASLKWIGLFGPDGPESYERLCALLKRFGMPPA